MDREKWENFHPFGEKRRVEVDIEFGRKKWSVFCYSSIAVKVVEGVEAGEIRTDLRK